MHSHDDQSGMYSRRNLQDDLSYRAGYSAFRFHKQLLFLKLQAFANIVQIRIARLEPGPSFAQPAQ